MNGQYELKTKNISNSDKEFIRENLVNEFNIEIPENAEITKVIFKRIWDGSNYKVTYLYNGENIEKESYIDSDGIKLDQYMKENAKCKDIYYMSIPIIIFIIQILLPATVLINLIKSIKKKNNIRR